MKLVASHFTEDGFYKLGDSSGTYRIDCVFHTIDRYVIVTDNNYNVLGGYLEENKPLGFVDFKAIWESE